MWNGNTMRQRAYPPTSFVQTSIILQSLTYVVWLGHQFLVPKKAHEWIEAEYGQSWNVPLGDKYWDWWSSPQNYIEQDLNNWE